MNSIAEQKRGWTTALHVINTNPLDEIIKTTSSKGIHKSMGGLAAAISKTERQTHRTPALKLSHFKTAFLI